MANTNTAGPELHVKVKGSLAIIYVDAGTMQPVPLAGFSDEPLGALAQTFKIDEIMRMYPNCRIVKHEKYTPEPPTVPNVERGAVNAMLNKLGEGIPPEVTSVETTPTQPKTEEAPTVGMVIEANSILNQAMQEFRILLAKYYANTEDVKSKIEVQAVGNFILALAPDMADELQKAKHSFEKPSFSL